MLWMGTVWSSTLLCLLAVLYDVTVFGTALLLCFYSCVIDAVISQTNSD